MLRSLLAYVWMCAGVLLVPALVALAGVRRHAHLRDTESQTRWMRVAAAATLVGLAAVALSALLGAGPMSATVTAALLALAVLVVAYRTPSWATRGAVVGALLVTGGVAFLAWVLHRLLQSSLPTWQAVVSGVAWVLLLYATTQLRGPVQARLGARAEARPLAAGAAAAQPWRRQLWPAAALVTAGAVAVVGTSVGVETGQQEEPRAGRARTSTAGPPSSAAPPATTQAAPAPEPQSSPPPVGATAADAGLGPQAVSEPRARHTHGSTAADRRSKPLAGTSDRRVRAGETRWTRRAVGHGRVERTDGARGGGTGPAAGRGGDGPTTERARTVRRPAQATREGRRAPGPTTDRDGRRRARDHAVREPQDRTTRRADGGARTRPARREPAVRDTVPEVRAPRPVPSLRVRPEGRVPTPARPERPGRVPSTRQVEPERDAPARTWRELIDPPRREPEDRPPKVWGVMPEDALPPDGSWD